MEGLVDLEGLKVGLKLLLLVGLLLQSYIDLRWQLLLDEINLALALAGVVYGYCFLGWSESIGGSVLFGGLLAILYCLAQGGLGFGDVKLGAALGLWLGIYGSWFCLVLALFLGVVVALLGCMAGLLNRKSLVPFGPFLATAALLLMYQEQLLLKLLERW